MNLDKQLQVQFVKQHPNAKVPQYATEGSSGADLCSVENTFIKPGERKLISTGLAVAIPNGYEIQIRPRSGLALKKGIMISNAPGSIDSDYRGILGVILYNTSSEDFIIKIGDRIAQAVLAPVCIASFVEVNTLDETARGAGGYGSTGTR